MTSDPQGGLLTRVRFRLNPDAEILATEGEICVGDDWDEVRDYISLLTLADDLLDERQRHIDEIDRLRVALEQIYGDVNAEIFQLREYARNAIEGITDETKP